MAQKVSSSVNAGAVLSQDVVPGGSQFLTVIGVVGNSGSAAGAAGDVSVQVFPYMDDAKADGSGATLSDLPLPTLDSVAAILANSKAQVLARYRVTGIRKVQIQVKNNNVAAKPVVIDFNQS